MKHTFCNRSTSSRALAAAARNRVTSSSPDDDMDRVIRVDRMVVVLAAVFIWAPVNDAEFENDDVTEKASVVTDKTRHTATTANIDDLLIFDIDML